MRRGARCGAPLASPSEGGPADREAARDLSVDRSSDGHGLRCGSGAMADLAARWSVGEGGDADGDAPHDARRDAPIDSASPSVADSPARSIPRDREGAATRAVCGVAFKPRC